MPLRGVLLVSDTEQQGKRIPTCLIEQAYGMNLSGKTYLLACDAKDPEFVALRVQPADVQKAGKRLYDALVADLPLQNFFAAANGMGAGPFPLYLRVATPYAEELPWEVLWETQRDFMILDAQGRWPIARRPFSPKPSDPTRFVGDRLRMAVVLAAARESGLQEWNNLMQGLENLTAEADFRVFVSEKSVYNALSQAVLPNGRSVAVEYVQDGPALISRVRDHGANLVHFFCHGVADVRPELEVETRADRTAGKDRGSVSLTSDLLTTLAPMRSLLLVVLNCCQGAKPAPQLHSLARDLVREGVPAVVAMRESVNVIAANLFTQHFYRSLVNDLNLRFPNNPLALADPPPIDDLVWVEATQEARRKLAMAYGPNWAKSTEWTYPVVYVSSEEVPLKRRQPKKLLTADEREELTAKLDAFRLVLPNLTHMSGDGAEMRAAFAKQIAELEEQLAG